MALLNPLNLIVMKSYLLTLIAFAFFTCQAQTKQETENWIKDKMTTYHDMKLTDISGSEYATTKIYVHYKNLQVRFSGCDLIINEDMYERRYTPEDVINSTPKKEKYTQTLKYIIPLGRLIKVDYTTRSIIFKTEHRSVQCFRSEDHGKSYERMESSESTFIGFDKYGEENLDERMIKAFNHLQTYCPLTRSSEAF